MNEINKDNVVEILRNTRHNLIYELGQGKISQDSIEEIRHYIEEIWLMTEKTPKAILDEYGIKYDKNGKLI